MSNLKNKYTLSIDPSLTCTGLAVFQGSKLIEASYISIPKSDRRLRLIIQEYMDLLDKYSFDCLCIETQYIPRGRRSNAPLKVTEIKGVYVGIFLSRFAEAEYFEVTPLEAKKFLGVKKMKNSKQEVLDKIRMIYPDFEIKKHDVSDAIAIGLCGIRKYEDKMIIQKHYNSNK